MHHSASIGTHTPYGSVERSFRNQSEASEEAALSRQVILYCLLAPGTSGMHACQYSVGLLQLLMHIASGGASLLAFPPVAVFSSAVA